MRHYESPAIREVGSLASLTQQQFNKIGRSTDVFSQETNNAVIGSLTPPQG
jgi:hypothetical protein